MKIFSYKAVSEDGPEMQGTVKAHDQDEARTILERRGLCIRALIETPVQNDTSSNGNEIKKNAYTSINHTDEHITQKNHLNASKCRLQPGPGGGKGNRIDLLLSLPQRQYVQNVKNRGTEVESFCQKIRRQMPIPPSEIVVFFNQLACLYQAGVALPRSLYIISQQLHNTRFQQIINEVRLRIESGSSFTGALDSYSDIFSKESMAIIGCGEVTGRLDTMLYQVAALKEKGMNITRKLKQEATYPVIVLFSMFAFIFIVGRFLIHHILSILPVKNVELPLLTKLLIYFYEVMTHPIIVFAVIAASFILLHYYRKMMRYESTILWRDQLLCSIPVLGQLFKKLATLRFCNSLTVLLESGISMLKAISLAAEASGNRLCVRDSLKIQELIREGKCIHEGMQEVDFFPPLVQAMIKVGEESGTLPLVLAYTVKILESDMDNALRTFYSLLEPLSIVLLGVAVGGLLAAVLSPLCALFSSMGM